MWATAYNILAYKIFVPVAQLDRALASGARGCAFESHRGYYKRLAIYCSLNK
jgi:hypothetical protein